MNTQDMNQMMRELMEGLSAEQRKKLEEDVNHEYVQHGVQKILEDYFPTYNFLIAQAGKLFQLFEQDRTEVATAVAVMAGMCIGSMAGDKKDLSGGMIKLVEIIAKTIASTHKTEADDQAMSEMFAHIMTTGQAVEASLMKKLVEKNMKPFDPRQGEDYKDIMKGVSKKQVGGE